VEPRKVHVFLSDGPVGGRCASILCPLVSREKTLGIHRSIHSCGKRVERWNASPAYTTFSVENGESGFRRVLYVGLPRQWIVWRLGRIGGGGRPCCEPNARLRYPVGHQARSSTSARVLGGGRGADPPDSGHRSWASRHRSTRATSQRCRARQTRCWKAIGDVWRYGEGPGAPEKLCAASVLLRAEFHREMRWRACRTAEYPQLSTLSTGACVRLQRDPFGGAPARFSRRSACDSEAEVGARSVSGHRSRERCRPLYLVGRRSGSVGSAIVGRLTPAHLTCILRHPCARPALGRKLRVSFTSRLLGSCRGAERQVRKREEDLSAEQAQAQEDPRLSGPHGHSRWQGRAQAPTRQGS
jgi:hypothetical protein